MIRQSYSSKDQSLSVHLFDSPKVLVHKPLYSRTSNRICNYCGKQDKLVVSGVMVTKVIQE
jgi:hypothetical protein